jgi:uncharacterized membrane protein
MLVHMMAMMITGFILALQIVGATNGYTWSVVAAILLGGCLVLQGVMFGKRYL